MREMETVSTIVRFQGYGSKHFVANNFMVRKGGFEPPRLSAPPPQDGVSASFTTSALAPMRPILRETPKREPQTGKGISITANHLRAKGRMDRSRQPVYTCFATLLDR